MTKFKKEWPTSQVLYLPASKVFLIRVTPDLILRFNDEKK